jgi:hypothetical protein
LYCNQHPSSFFMYILRHPLVLFASCTRYKSTPITRSSLFYLLFSPFVLFFV